MADDFFQGWNFTIALTSPGERKMVVSDFSDI